MLKQYNLYVRLFASSGEEMHLYFNTVFTSELITLFMYVTFEDVS